MNEFNTNKLAISNENRKTSTSLRKAVKLMHMRINITYLSLAFILVLHFSHGEINTIMMTGEVMYQADSLYSNGHYSAALVKYRQLLSHDHEYQDDMMDFRMAYAMFRTAQYDSSARLFFYLWSKRDFLTEFSQFFYISSLWQINKGKAVREAEHFIDQYNSHALADSLIIPCAEYFYQHRYYTKARDYYLLAKKRDVSIEKKAQFSILAAKSLYFQGQKKLAKKEFTQVLRKYPGNEAALELAILLKSIEKEYFRENFFKIVDVYYSNKDYDELRSLIESYIKSEKDKNNIQKARYYLVKIYYALGRSRTALYGFNNLLKEDPSPKLEPYIRLYIARCHYRLGQKEKAIQSYMDYADRYPRRRNAPEAVWKCARINEESGNLDEAVVFFERLRKRWPSSYYAREAFFREGFDLFRMGHLQDAVKVFDAIRFKSWPDTHTDRAQYWSAICRETLGDSIGARELRVKLSDELWDNYYTMKSYLLHKDYIDSTRQVIRQFQNTADALNYFSSGFAALMTSFEDAFLIHDLLGTEYGLMALSDIKLKAKTMEEWVALAELFKKFGDYGRTYTIYDYINRKFFYDRPYTEKAFMIKERFPFYFDQQVDYYSEKYKVEKELVLGVMKQESTFRHRVVSRANAWGLMQLIPATAGDMARLTGIKIQSNEQLFDPEINIHFGTLYLRQLNQLFNGQKEYMLAAYNAGPHRVKRWRMMPGSAEPDVFIENIEFKETRNYVKKVMKNYWAYKLLGVNFQTDHPGLLLGLR